ncbi:hypothetical protein PoMZ_07663 [Pyricularia oryzae]|uniref:Uncharacterized protein n=1 Tax=Pyricularia oryzae TaxID=318829 RepID=A0A4P7NFQ1_PYROR|nr:hypothetical protein PoMZ_07663 [Pyricularia oryzae]
MISRPAPIDGPNLTSDVPRIAVVGQKGNDGGDLAGLGEPALRDALAQAVVGRLAEPLHHGHGGGAGRDAVDPDAVLGVLDGGGLAHGDDGALGHRVGRRVRRAHQAGDAGGQHDGAALRLRGHVAQPQLQQQVGAQDVVVEDLGGRGGRHFQQRAARPAHARVVDQDVEPPVRAADVRVQLRDAGLGPRVQRARNHRRAQLGGQRFLARLVGRDDGRAFGRQPPDDGGAAP